jgi:hypothetical protein
MDMIYSQIFDLSLDYDQIKFSSEDYLDDVLLMLFRLGTSSCPSSLTNTFSSFMRYMSLSLECFGKFVVEPIDDILILSMSKEVHIEQLALVLETFRNHLCVVAKYLF